MRRLLTIGLLFALVSVFAFALHLAAAPPAVSTQDAIALAAAHPSFAEALSSRPSWTAAAYFTGNSYGIWRVQFYDSAGEDMGWADVNIDKGRVYSLEAHYGALELQRQAAEGAVKDFIVNSPEVWELMENPDPNAMYVDYDGWGKAWGVWIDRGVDSLYAVVQFEGLTPTSLTNPRLVGIFFPNVLSYDDWYVASQESAIAIAFNQPEIAAAVRGYDGWDATAELADEGNLWVVKFLAGEQEIAQATVDTSSETVIVVNLVGV